MFAAESSPPLMFKVRCRSRRGRRRRRCRAVVPNEVPNLVPVVRALPIVGASGAGLTKISATRIGGEAAKSTVASNPRKTGHLWDFIDYASRSRIPARFTTPDRRDSPFEPRPILMTTPPFVKFRVDPPEMDEGSSHSCSVAVALAARLDGAAGPAGRDERLDRPSRRRGAERDDCLATGSMLTIGRNSASNSGHLRLSLQDRITVCSVLRVRQKPHCRTKVTSSRGDKIRTCDLLVPNQALYQAEPHPDLRIAVSRLNASQAERQPATR